jgi:hypothetical protein
VPCQGECNQPLKGRGAAPIEITGSRETDLNTTQFDIISNLTLDASATSSERCYLTFDMDWACDEVLSDTIDLVEEAGVAVTWFVTHETPLLARLRCNPNFELGIHPNFNFLLQGDNRNGASAEEVIDRLLAIVPEAKSVRSHSMTQNSGILQLFADKGITRDCNHFIPEQIGIKLKPWRLWNGLIKVPYFWEDDIACLSAENTAVEELVRREGLKVFNFHPIHVFLNTECIERYEAARPYHDNPQELIGFRFAGPGARTALKTLLESAQQDADRLFGVSGGRHD